MACAALVGGLGVHHLAGKLPDGNAVLRQVGLAATGVGEQDLALVAHDQGHGQDLRGIAVVFVAGIPCVFVDALCGKAPAQKPARLLHAQIAVQYARRIADDGEGERHALRSLSHRAGGRAHHARQPHTAQPGQGL